MAYNFHILVNKDDIQYSLKGKPLSDFIEPDLLTQKIDRSEDVLPVIQKLDVWLERLIELLLTHSETNVRLACRQLFSTLTKKDKDAKDDFLIYDDGKQRGTFAGPEAKDVLLTAASALYTAIADYLASGERYVSLDAHSTYLFSSWQSYNLLKAICREQSRCSPDRKLAMARAHTRLTGLLNDARFQFPARELAAWADFEKPNDQLLRQRMRRSLILSFKKDDPLEKPWHVGGGEINFSKPIPAPGYYPDPGDKKDEKEECLHPVFSESAEGKRTARSLVTHQLLPRYDFDSSLQIARWLKNPAANVLRPSDKYLSLMALFTICAVLVFAGTWLSSSEWGVFLGGACVIAVAEFFLLAVSVWFFFVRQFDSGILIHLTLPRLVGGIVAGFLLFITQEDSVKLVNAFSLDRSSQPGDRFYLFHSGAPLVALLWIGILSVSWVYLYKDVQPITLDTDETRRRTLFTMFLAVLTSGFVTLLGAALVAAAYSTSAQPWGEPLLGPFGYFDLRQFLTFAPLALIAGMVSQFILEDRTLPTSVWSQEQD